jgi:hypothetical protein
MAEKKGSWKSFALVLVGVLISLANMYVAWSVIASSNSFVMTGLVSKGGLTATSQALEMVSNSSPEKIGFLDRIVQADVNHRLIANKQTIVIVALASSFSLMAIGFALFVMGIEAAYSIEGKNPTGSLVISASSPGLVCFLLAALVICFSLSQKSNVKFDPIENRPTSDSTLVEDAERLPPPVPLPPKFSDETSKTKAP